jgi:hypothetical protein
MIERAAGHWSHCRLRGRREPLPAAGWPTGLGGAGGEAHGLTELAVTNDLARQGSLAALLAAELADDPGLALVYVDALAHQRRALAIDAAVAVGCERSDATPQEEALQLFDVAVLGGHGTSFAAPDGPPSGPIFGDLSGRFVWTPIEGGRLEVRDYQNRPTGQGAI